VAVTEDLKKRVKAGKMIRELGGIIGGGGGGRDDLAEAGGRDPSKLDEALRAGVAMVAELAGATT
jgi:alanyl-tRNA synthetase